MVVLLHVVNDVIGVTSDVKFYDAEVTFSNKIDVVVNEDNFSLSGFSAQHFLFKSNPAVENMAQTIMHGRIQDLPKGANNDERVECEPITGVWALWASGGRALSGVRGRAPGGRQGSMPPEAGSSSSIFIQKTAKSLVFKLKKTPMLGPCGRGRPVRPYLDPSVQTMHLIYCMRYTSAI